MQQWMTMTVRTFSLAISEIMPWKKKTKSSYKIGCFLLIVFAEIFQQNLLFFSSHIFL